MDKELFLSQLMQHQQHYLYPAPWRRTAGSGWKKALQNQIALSLNAFSSIKFETWSNAQIFTKNFIGGQNWDRLGLKLLDTGFTIS